MFKAILGCFRCKNCSPQEDIDHIRTESDSKLNEESDDHARKDNGWKDNSCTDLNKYYSSSSFLLVNGNPGDDFVRHETFHHNIDCFNQDKSRIELPEELNNSSYIKINGSSGRGTVKQDSSGEVVEEGEPSDDLTTDDDIKGAFVKENTLSFFLAAEDTILSDLMTENIVKDELLKEVPTTCIYARENDKTSVSVGQNTMSKETVRKVSTSCKFTREKFSTANNNIPDTSSLDPILEESTPSGQNSEETILFVGQQNNKYGLENNSNVTSINDDKGDTMSEYGNKCKLEYLATPLGENDCFRTSLSHSKENGTLTIRNEAKNTFKANPIEGSDEDYHESDMIDKTNNNTYNIGDNVNTKHSEFRDDYKTVSSNHTQKPNTAVILKPDTKVIIGSGFYDNNIDWSKYSLKLTGENNCFRKSLNYAMEDNVRTKPISCINEEKRDGVGHESQLAHEYRNMAEDYGRINEESLLVHSDRKIDESQSENETENIKAEKNLCQESQMVHEYENMAGEYLDRTNEASQLVHSVRNSRESKHVHTNENIKTEEHISLESEASQMVHEYKNITEEQFESTNEASLLIHYDRKSDESKPVNKNENIKTEEHSGRESEASQLVHEYQNMAEEHFGGINKASRLVHSDSKSEESNLVHEYQNFKQLMNRQYTSEHILSTPKAIHTDSHGNMAVCYVKEDKSDRNSKESTFVSVESQTVVEFKTNMHLMQDNDSLEYTSTSENIKVIDKVNKKEFSLVEDDLDANGREANDYNRISNTEAFCDGKHFTICGSYIIGRIPRKGF